MRGTAAARRYAKALFSLAREESRIAEVLRELERLCEVLDASVELRDALYVPIHTGAERHRVFSAVADRLDLSQTLRRFCAVLIEHRRMRELAAVRDEFARRVDEASGRVAARVRSAAPLRGDQLDRLRRALSERTGREVEVDVEVDPALIGGVVASVGGLVLDGSLRAQLQQLRATLTRGH